MKILSKNPNSRRSSGRKVAAFLFIFFSAVPFLINFACTKSENSSNSAGILEKGGSLSFCQFGPKVTVYEEKAQTPGSATGPCHASARIQAVQWKCANPAQVQILTWDYLKKLTQEAEASCERFCKDLPGRCKSIFRKPETCGLTLQTEEAKESGERLGCRSSCEGQALAYCSIYNAGFQNFNAELMNSVAPNCLCTEDKTN